MMAEDKKKKKYLQAFKADYCVEFPFIKQSRKSVNYAFCVECATDISIGHGGKNDIVQHMKMKKHVKNAEINEKNETEKNKMRDFLLNKNEVIRAECLFTAFLIEHNLPLSCSDHIGSLLRKIFPQSEIAKNYGCARTKTSAIVSEMASNSQIELISTLQNRPFCLATDGSNDTGSQLYPIVVTFYSDNGPVVNNLLAVPVLKGNSTALNISNLMLEKLNQLNVPIQNCLAFSSDNAAVMVGNKGGVVTLLKEHQKNLISVGCPCHLLNLAAEKGASCLPLNVDELLVDLFYYFKKSSKRIEQLEKFQDLYNDETKKLLKHVATRWLSTTKCLQRLLYLWEPLIAFFKTEIDKSNHRKKDSKKLEFFTIPKKSGISSKYLEESTTSGSADKKSLKRKQNDSNSITSEEPNKKKIHKSGNFEARRVLSREERLFYLLTSDVNKAYCLFLVYVSPVFEKFNLILQGKTPLIHKLNSLLFELLRQILIKFVKADILRGCSDLLTLNYHTESNQKKDADWRKHP